MNYRNLHDQIRQILDDTIYCTIFNEVQGTYEATEQIVKLLEQTEIDEIKKENQN